ncbi:hypothetical protein KC336_g20167 [Hortaea werneckii]|nr:hypothetical protein KC336_g20167 [Hortaea werneckii]
MPSIDATVAWAVPVPVEVLGAHLEAYVNLQPTINTLRMCHRFGKGEDVAITRLPVELLSEVEDILMEEERRKTREEWETDFRCFQLHCDPSDHYGPCELDDLTRDIERDVRRDCGGKCYSQKHHDEWVKERVWDFMEEDYFDAHWDMHDRWRYRVGAPGSPMHIFLKIQADYFEQQFGLAIWTSHVAVDGPYYHRFGDDLEGKTTVAYLKLPSHEQRFAQQRKLKEEPLGAPEEDMEMGYGVRLQEAKALTDSDIRRFKRAMNTLNLQPRVHESQRTAWNNGVDENKECLVDCEPQLTVLLRSSLSP